MLTIPGIGAHLGLERALTMARNTQQLNALFGRLQEGRTLARQKSPVIGYFAQFGPMDVACTDGDACVIAGSREAMEHYLADADPLRAGRAVIRKTRFKEIRQGLELGGAYAFDERSYEEFYPLARKIGLPVEEDDFETARERGDRFFTVRLLGV